MFTFADLRLLSLGAVLLTVVNRWPLLWVYSSTTPNLGGKRPRMPRPQRRGKACAQTILGLVATGDASISAAKAAGGITRSGPRRPHGSQHSWSRGDFCTIVKGK